MEKLNLPVKFGRAIHVPQKMYGLPKTEVMEACYQRALQETTRPDVQEDVILLAARIFATLVLDVSQNAFDNK